MTRGRWHSLGTWYCWPAVLQASRECISFEQGWDFADNNTSCCTQVPEVTDRHLRLFAKGMGRIQIFPYQFGSGLEAAGNPTAVRP